MLALRLGGCVADLKRRMPYREYLAWRAFHKLSPIDDERCFDRPSAQVSSVLSQVNGGHNKVDDYLPYRRKPRPDEEWFGLHTYLHSRAQ